MYTGLSHGAARLMEDHFQHPLRDIIIEKMFTGVWAGTMCLTEPGAGSDVGILKTIGQEECRWYLLHHRHQVLHFRRRP